jgi:hypothetical protein
MLTLAKWARARVPRGMAMATRVAGAKEAMTRAARAMAMATKRAMAMATRWVMAMATRVVGKHRWQQ